MGFRAISNLIADARTKLKPASVKKFRLEFAGEAKENVALLAPVVGTVAGRILDHADTNRTKLPGTPKSYASLSRMFGGFDCSPIRDTEGELGDLHVDHQLVEMSGCRLTPALSCGRVK